MTAARRPTPPLAAASQLTPASAAAQYAALRADVAGRLARSCAEMPRETFDVLVDDICAMKLRWVEADGRDHRA